MHAMTSNRSQATRERSLTSTPNGAVLASEYPLALLFNHHKRRVHYDTVIANRMISPRFHEFADKYDKLSYYSIDVDAVPDVAEECGIQSAYLIAVLKMYVHAD